MIREIVHIDEDKCDGCGLCVPACHEGAIQIIDGKAKLVADNLCDGLGACLGHCPQDAITVEKREADDFDEQSVKEHFDRTNTPPEAEANKTFTPLNPHVAKFASADSPHKDHSTGCPAARFTQLNQAGGTITLPSDDSQGANIPSELTHFPIQLRLLPPTAPVLRQASLLLLADCVAIAYASFQKNMLRGRAVAVACPKLDDTSGYLAKLTEMIKLNDLKDITVAHMEVPCCTGILHLALEARRQSGKDIPIRSMVVSVRGELLTDQEIPCESMA
ncbi:MAG: ATP-binding protein [Planctomycetota bacterium]|jgi:NAD-dependent dihydropyrimidine dehydrogenase PreA subunit